MRANNAPSRLSVWSPVTFFEIKTLRSRCYERNFVDLLVEKALICMCIQIMYYYMIYNIYYMTMLTNVLLSSNLCWCGFASLAKPLAGGRASSVMNRQISPPKLDALCSFSFFLTREWPHLRVAPKPTGSRAHSRFSLPHSLSTRNPPFSHDSSHCVRHQIDRLAVLVGAYQRLGWGGEWGGG